MLRSLWFALLLLFVHVSANAEMILIDDFNDGNDEEWTRLDPTVDEPWGPAQYDLHDGNYSIESSDVVTEFQVSGPFSDWDGSSEPSFSNGYVRAVVRSNSIATNPFLYMRATPGVAPKESRGYFFGGESTTDVFFIDGDAGLHGTWSSPISFREGEDYIIEGGVVDDVRVSANGTRREGVWVTLRVWRPGEDEPANPQLRVWDSTPLPPGALGVGAWAPRGNYPNSATFDDIYFTPFPDVSSVMLQAGDADQDLSFDQLDLVRVQVAGKYQTGETATWGEGDWNGAPGGEPGAPPPGDGAFDQFDIMAALLGGKYMAGPYASIAPGGVQGVGRTSVVHDARTGEIDVDALSCGEMTSVNVDSAACAFNGVFAENTGGRFDNNSDCDLFETTFGSSFDDVARAGLTEDFVANDLTVVGSLVGGGSLGDVDLIYIPEPSSVFLALLGIIGLLHWRR